jgi:hypothetical protein
MKREEIEKAAMRGFTAMIGFSVMLLRQESMGMIQIKKMIKE